MGFCLASHKPTAAALILLLSASCPCAQQAPATATGLLTVDRIYGQPGLGGRLTRGIAWSADGNKFSFFEPLGAGREARTALYAMEVSTGERSLLIPPEKLESVLPAPSDKPSQATGLGRHAPSQVEWSVSGDALLLASSRSLAWFDLKAQQGHVLVAGKEGLADAKISPDGTYVSFIRDHNLWLVPSAGGKERLLTTGGTEQLRKGELDWVYPEELDITTAYWWAPDSSAVAYLEMNESKVTQFSLTDFESYTGQAELQRYPVPGGNNPEIRVLVNSVGGGQPRVMDIGTNTNLYIPRVNWLPDSKHLSIQRLNREQTILDLLLADSQTGQSSALLTEKDLYWINVNDDLRFLKHSNRFLWSSERSGYRHLYLYELNGKELAQLTKGDWEVTHVEAVDEAKGLVYFSSTEKSPIERHLYRVSLDGSGFTRLSKKDGMHVIQFAPNAGNYLDTYSNSAAPPRQDLYRADGSKIATLNENQVPELAQYHLSPVEFLTVRSHDGVLFNCFMIKPPDFDPARKYPVLVYTYGGPHAQVVLNAWGGSNFLWHQMMAQKGYIIFALDNRGSAGRGHLFEEPIHYRLGAQELSDQRDGAEWLRGQAYVDGTRLGVWGWSYGGHMTLHAMFDMPGLFKAGFAGGPVTNWRYYDTIYTERYLGLIPQREKGYQESSPVESAGKLKGKLLIAHGTGDDNVHYSNTLALLNELIEHGKYPEVLAFPGRGHGVSDPPARRVLMQHVTQFFLDNL
jgi:dipeptidyl-peptidase 4